jgi:hydrogenase maturation protein HypF
MLSPQFRIHLAIQGAVQGVGFRPFVYRLAQEIKLKGWIENSAQGVLLEVEGDREQLAIFQQRLRSEKPTLASIQSLETTHLDPVSYQDFKIRSSHKNDSISAVILPDISTCPACLEDILTPGNRRHRYPFTNCTNCGPRYSIIRSLPYDRQNTTMADFKMCPRCENEYNDPTDRRFHAQPNACPECGPQLQLWSDTGTILAEGDEALNLAIKSLKANKIVAVKGVGGFQLVTRADSEDAVLALRQRKKRGRKPFAILLPSLEEVRKICLLSTSEAQLLKSPMAPIVLLERKDMASKKISFSVAPGNPYLGVMLPSNPLHYLLLEGVKVALVATSGNLAHEPICINNSEAAKKLAPLVDLFLVHNRPIERQVDDSIARIIQDRELVLRRARGYAPLPLPLPKITQPILALGAQQKNSIALAFDKQVILSQHIGDLETAATLKAFQNTTQTLLTLYKKKPLKIVCDSHPDYHSSQFAAELAQPHEKVQHHYAHILSCMAENRLEAPLLGVAWDGTGLGDDGTLWGGEFLLINSKSYKRLMGLHPFLLAGGSQAIKEPKRSALGLLYELWGDDLLSMTDLPLYNLFTAREWKLLIKLLSRKINTPLTSSIGRLFDGVSAILGLCQINSFEGEAAMELEFAAKRATCGGCYPFRLEQSVDWRPMILAILEDIKRKLPVATIALKFHHTLVEIVVAVVKRSGERRVILTGGCFQNRYLLETTIQRLQKEGFSPYWHQRVPPNDGGIALGQLWSVIR